MSMGITVTSQGAVIHCPRCDKRVLDGNALLGRVTIIGRTESKTKCPRCKHMVSVPVMFTSTVPKAPAPA